MRLLKMDKITYIKKQRFGGAMSYICDCGHKVVIPIYKNEFKCLYCGKKEVIK